MCYYCIKFYQRKYYQFKFQSQRSLFHGTIDFYHLIKITVRKLINIDENINPFSIAINSIERNFGEREQSIKTFKSIISTFQYCNESDNYDVKNAIENNIIDNQSILLLIISNSSISQFLIKTILDNLNKKYITFLGMI